MLLTAFPATTDLIVRIAASDLAVVLVGEDSETRRAIAAAIHRRSSRATGPFLGIDCALARADLEFALFGSARTTGMLERARGGTVWVDAIDVVSPTLQMKLLRAIEEHQVPSDRARALRPIDVRLIVGSAEDLARHVARGRLRADLYYRLDGITLAVPDHAIAAQWAR